MVILLHYGKKPASQLSILWALSLLLTKSYFCQWSFCMQISFTKSSRSIQTNLQLWLWGPFDPQSMLNESRNQGNFHYEKFLDRPGIEPVLLVWYGLAEYPSADFIGFMSHWFTSDFYFFFLKNNRTRNTNGSGNFKILWCYFHIYGGIINIKRNLGFFFIFKFFRYNLTFCLLRIFGGVLIF